MRRGLQTSTGYGIDQGEGFLAVARCRGRRAETLFAGPPGGPGRGPPLPDLGAAQRRHRALAAAAMPARDGALRRLRVPLASPARARRVLPSLLDPQLPFPLESCAAAFPEVRRDPDGGCIALAAVAPRELLERRIGELRAAGFDPAVIAPEGLALWHGSVREAPPAGPAAARLVLYAGTDRWVAAAGIGRGFRWAVSGAPPAGATADAAVAALAPALRRLRADEEFRGAALDGRWCGPAVPDGAARAAAEAALSDGRAAAFAVHADAPGLLARALARAARTAGGPMGNLRSGAAEHPDLAALRARAELRAWIALAAAGLALALANVGGRAALARRDTAAQEELARAARAVVQDVVPRGRERERAATAADARRAELAPFARGLAAPAAEALAAVLPAAAAAGVTLQEFQSGDATLRLAGLAADRAAAEGLAARLQSAGWRTELQWTGGAADRAPFELRGTRP